MAKLPHPSIILYNGLQGYNIIEKCYFVRNRTVHEKLSLFCSICILIMTVYVPISIMTMYVPLIVIPTFGFDQLFSACACMNNIFQVTTFFSFNINR